MKKGLYIVCISILSIMIYRECCDSQANGGTEAVSVFSNPSVGSDKEKIAYLTFDDGPSEVTPQILEILKRKNAKATFFLVGNEITKEREEVVRREVAEGHSVGVHTYSHEKEVMYCDRKHFFEDFNLCRARIHEVTGVSPVLHRFPWGSNNGYVCSIVDEIIEQLQKENVMSFDWNVSGEDSVGRDVPKAVIYQNVAKDLERFDQPIILLHDSNGMKHTAEVLPEIIDLIREKGYSFQTLQNRKGYTFPSSWRR